MSYGYIDYVIYLKKEKRVDLTVKYPSIYYESQKTGLIDKRTIIGALGNYITKEEVKNRSNVGDESIAMHFANRTREMLGNYHMVLPYEFPLLTIDKLIQFLDNNNFKLQNNVEYLNIINEHFKIFVTDTDENLPPSRVSLNRCFGNVDLSHRINKPFESVLITKEFESNDIHSIIQMTGRCGRPGEEGSKISVVYMSDKCYERIVKESEVSSVENLAYRYKHYLKKIDSSIESNIEPDIKQRNIGRLFESFVLINP